MNMIITYNIINFLINVDFIITKRLRRKILIMKNMQQSCRTPKGSREKQDKYLSKCQIVDFEQKMKRKRNRRNKNIKSEKLWHDSACSLSFVSVSPFIERSQRFQYNSIYYHDDPYKPKYKQQTRQPYELLLFFRKQIKDATKNPTKKLKYQTSDIFQKKILKNSKMINVQTLPTKQNQKNLNKTVKPDFFKSITSSSQTHNQRSKQSFLDLLNNKKTNQNIVKVTKRQRVSQLKKNSINNNKIFENYVHCFPQLELKQVFSII